ncbi:hypothetical protein [Streptomyces hyderabadensis]|uniref:Integral membrane protein n=2 Tax=Streptomyces hyderabadensis TaxID=598549 RepID=A0ABP9IYV8_9ACTN
MAADGALRALRAAVFAAVCVALAALGHVLMSGTGLPWWVLLSGLAAVGAVGWSFGGRERRDAAVAALTVAVQAALHVGFTLAQSQVRPPTAAAGGTHSAQEWARYLLCGADPTPAQAARAYGIAQRAGLTEHLHHGPGDAASATATTGAADTSGPAGLLHAGHMTGTTSWGMLTAHLVAAVLCGLWLAQGERAAFALVRACSDRAFVPLRLVLVVLVPPACPPAFRPVRQSRWRLRRLLLAHTLATRGPPAVTVVV